MPDPHQVNVSAPAAVVILAALTVIGGTAGLVFVGDGRTAHEVFTNTILIAASIAALAVVVALGRTRGWPLRRAMLVRTGVGFGVMAFGVLVTVLLERSGTFSVLGGSFFVVPTGLFLAGMGVIARAMPPPGR